MPADAQAGQQHACHVVKACRERVYRTCWVACRASIVGTVIILFRWCARVQITPGVVFVCSPEFASPGVEAYGWTLERVDNAVIINNANVRALGVLGLTTGNSVGSKVRAWAAV